MLEAATVYRYDRKIDCWYCVKCQYTCHSKHMPDKNCPSCGRTITWIEPKDKLAEQCSDIETNLFDEEEIHENCTVQILRNSITGEVSIGWWENDKED